MPHAWGTNDCCLFCADAVLAMTGDDPAKALRGTYTDEAGAMAIVAQYGGMEELLTHFLGEPSGPLCARRGDVVMVHTKHADACGIFDGQHIACVGDTELLLLPFSRGLKSWRVD